MLQTDRRVLHFFFAQNNKKLIKKTIFPYVYTYLEKLPIGALKYNFVIDYQKITSSFFFQDRLI